MKIAFFLSHPAHFHLFKNVIPMVSKNHTVKVVYNDKDILKELIQTSPMKEISINIKTKKRVSSRLGLYLNFVLKCVKAIFVFGKENFDLVIGTSVLIPIAGRLLPYHALVITEDDYEVTKIGTNLGYSNAETILVPIVCNMGKYESKTVKYHGYNELAYLHPNHFQPDPKIVDKYVPTGKRYFLIRLVNLFAYHDKGAVGIGDELALQIIEKLIPFGNVFVSSERLLPKSIEKYLLKIDPQDIHHLIAYSDLFICDSQTMAAEAGVLGVPFLRYNDFIGRHSYMRELEEIYNLGYGFTIGEEEEFLRTINDLLLNPDIKSLYLSRRIDLLAQKIDVAKFISWFIENYPNSVTIMNKSPEFQRQFLNGLKMEESLVDSNLNEKSLAG